MFLSSGQDELSCRWQRPKAPAFLGSWGAWNPENFESFCFKWWYRVHLMVKIFVLVSIHWRKLFPFSSLFFAKCKMVETSNLLSMNFSRKYRVSSRYFIVGVKIAGCWHILTGLMVSPLTHCTVHECCTCKLQQNCRWHNSVDVIHRAVKLWYDKVYLTL